VTKIDEKHLTVVKNT